MYEQNPITPAGYRNRMVVMELVIKIQYMFYTGAAFYIDRTTSTLLLNVLVIVLIVNYHLVFPCVSGSELE